MQGAKRLAVPSGVPKSQEFFSWDFLRALQELFAVTPILVKGQAEKTRHRRVFCAYFRRAKRERIFVLSLLFHSLQELFVTIR